MYPSYETQPRPNSRVLSFPTEEPTCDDCGRFDPNISLCTACDNVFCPPCWDKQVSHKRKRGKLRLRHEKTDITLARKISEALYPTNDVVKLTELHQEDVQSTWFGIERPPDNGLPIFKDYGRLGYLLSSTAHTFRGTTVAAQLGRDDRTPSLVSFVGETGAGKSTLIKLIIDLHIGTRDANTYPTPVVGASGITDPTSENVHLYADPVTAVTEAPLFFADCEGLVGGEREPVSSKLRRSLKPGTREDESQPLPVSERELEWADTPHLRSREFAVTNLYPRLLYTFSDVIVFVLKNSRVIERVLTQLVEWAAAALEMSSNQPVLPHVIIALNASENDLEDNEWDPDYATESVLASISRTLFHNPTFQKYARFWRDRNRPIATVDQLISSYYSSLKVVRIPEHGRPHLIQSQIIKLYTRVETACKVARDRKSTLRMLLDAEELQSYLLYAFDHFAVSLHQPFDFVQASFSNSPIPLDFGGNILKLAINLMRVWPPQSLPVLLRKLSLMVASCIMLDSTRRGIKGTALDIFPEYLLHLEAFLENLCERYWPCEYCLPNLRCVNVRSGHSNKGHQDKNGKVFADGDYQAQWSFDELLREFTCDSFFHLEELLESLRLKKYSGDSDMHLAAQIHRNDVMATFYQHPAQTDIRHRCNSNTVCLCCLSEPPEHSLPCGHVLCTPCIETYGRRRSKTEVDIEDCPLETVPAQLRKPWTVYFKPDSAGVRVLALDGGGIRGIVELEILRSIELAWKNMKGELSIQSFFDLVVGTSTGGLVALGLVARNWPVETCIERFKELCGNAFTRRSGGNIPFIGRLVESYNHSKYETAPLYKSLRTAFSDKQYLFGGQRYDQYWTSPVRVAVTTTIGSSSAALIANYNRHCEEKGSYQFLRGERADMDFKTWEAARATSAAPRYFKPFHHEASKQIYMDGALYHNNPIKIADKEWKLLWKTSKFSHLDIMVSLGTGYRPQQRQTPETNTAPKRGFLRNLRFLHQIAENHIKDALDSQKAYEEHISSLDSATRERFVRCNLEMEDLPSLDDVEALETLQHRTQNHCFQHSWRIKELALKLIATSFYFETERFQQLSPTSSTATGRVKCRLGEPSTDIVEIGKVINDQAYRGKDPFFLVRERGPHGKVAKHDLTHDVVARMIRAGRFQMPKVTIQLKNQLSEVEIQLSLNDDHTYPISGFPRCMCDDGQDKSTSFRPLPANPRRWAGRSNTTSARRRKLWQPPDRQQYFYERSKMEQSAIDLRIRQAHELPDQPMEQSTPPPRTLPLQSIENLTHIPPVCEMDDPICEIDGTEIARPAQELDSNQEVAAELSAVRSFSVRTSTSSDYYTCSEPDASPQESQDDVNDLAGPSYRPSHGEESGDIAVPRAARADEATHVLSQWSSGDAQNELSTRIT